MTLTPPYCPVGAVIVKDIEQKIVSMPDVNEVDVELVWDPAWNPYMISGEALKRPNIR
ncbi:MAG: hypothetical protein A4E24_02001 [Methanomethylovorans sp. PtaU1.Bin093]|uniref:metal-sulfur cluster assembly factor n=1 Tax=Methanomethylovorans sp. PtaU1.Bin093 TaxID=1811679 RepID=UPI0009C655C1|nr:hypothetical protein [Methanomethylovorans sp. PtaU1.Bin093]OPY18172.1 MAG: hypothetical protein A4E24_02001 [Methanomethylovorans sp. PtaU1.Bin093]